MKKFIRMLTLMSIVAISPAFAQDIEDVVVTSSILGTKKAKLKIPFTSLTRKLSISLEVTA